MHEASKCQGITASLGSSGFSLAQLSLVRRPGVGRAGGCALLRQLNASLSPSCSGDRAEQALQGASEHSGKQWSVWTGQHLHGTCTSKPNQGEERKGGGGKRKEKKHYVRKDFPQFYFLEDFPGFLLNIGGLNIYISIYMHI